MKLSNAKIAKTGIINAIQGVLTVKLTPSKRAHCKCVRGEAVLLLVSFHYHIKALRTALDESLLVYRFVCTRFFGPDRFA